VSDKEQIFTELQSYIVEQLGVEKEKVTRTAAFIEDLNADSLDLVEFAMGLEEKFGVTIADEDLAKIKTVQDAVDAIAEKKG
jgi:acyl carrier protein